MDNALLEVTVSTSGDTAVVRLVGELDVGTAPDLRAALLPLGDGFRQVDIDAGHLSFVDSTGLGLLVTLHRRLRAAGGPGVRILNPHERVTRVLTITSLDSVLDVVAGQ